jgi:hypothetical protein
MIGSKRPQTFITTHTITTLHIQKEKKEKKKKRKTTVTQISARAETDLKKI